MRTVVLENRPVLRTSDLDEARREIAKVFSPHRLDTVSGHDGLDVTMNAVQLETLRLAYLSHGTEVVVEPGELATYYNINLTLSGSWTLNCGRREAAGGPATAAVLNPTEAISMRWSQDCSVLAVRIDRNALDECLAQLLDRSVRVPIRFEPKMDLDQAPGGRWARIVQMLAAEVDEDDSVLGRPMAVRPFEDLVMTRLLVTHAHNFSHELECHRPPARPRVVKRAIEFIESHPRAPLTAADIARAAGSSVRSLQQGFAQHVGVSPMAYLRDVRLAHAHAELVQTDPASGVTVTDIALRWGFMHTARFAGLYRERYGTSPSQTLRS